MYESFGAIVESDDVEFRLFFPDTARDPTQYEAGGGLPGIKTIQVTGDFQPSIGQTAWDIAAAPALSLGNHPAGLLYSHRIAGLPDGFYQYKYFVTFENGERRWCGDPCSKYVAGNNENAGFVVGGNLVSSVIRPIENRLPLRDLVIYELMIDDFTADYRGTRAPVDAVREKIDHLLDLGVNAVEFMPWTPWPGGEFSWGYDPFLYFAVEDRYLRDQQEPDSADRLYRLARLIAALHEAGIHVIMDGVFNHVTRGPDPGRGFPYYWLYQEPQDSPFIGSFSQAGYFDELDYHNKCTQELIADACQHWVDKYSIDGIRFDYTLGFDDPGEPEHGITKLVSDLRSRLENGHDNFSLVLEHLTDNRFQAIDDTNRIGADACWYDRFLFDVPQAGVDGRVDGRLLRVLHTSRDFAEGTGPVTYIENHDHSTVVDRTCSRGNWWKTQSPAIALFTTPGAVLVHNGQEFGDDYWLPEDGSDRVLPRPLRWSFQRDRVGSALWDLYRRLVRLRRQHPALRSPNFFPDSYDDGETRLRPDGFGIDASRGIAVYHRWGPDAENRLERFVIVLNFSRDDHAVDAPVSVNGEWTDLLNGGSWTARDWRLPGLVVSSNWGRVLYRRD